MKKILLTGSTGFLGRHIKALADKTNSDTTTASAVTSAQNQINTYIEIIIIYK